MSFSVIVFFTVDLIISFYCDVVMERCVTQALSPPTVEANTRRARRSDRGLLTFSHVLGNLFDTL